MAQVVTIALSDYWWQWADLVVRWLHVVAGIAWIGASFYFIALDNHLEPPDDPRDAQRGVAGEVWELHGGGFYRVEKFRVAPERLPDPLHWFKWEAYTTWLSGFTLLIVVFYVHASTYLVDPSVRSLATWEAILISIGGLALAWLVYDGVCRTFPNDEGILAVLVFAFICVSAWGAGELFSARASYIQVGAMIGTMMVGNVFFVIIPAQRELVRAKKDGRAPDPSLGKRGKTRSVHNNYLTLPVVFAMLSGHFPFTYGHRHAWLILVALMAIGALTRHYFNLRHKGVNMWPILVVSAAGLLALALLLEPKTHRAGAAGATLVPFSQVQAIVQQRCAPCHSMHPTLVASAPLGIEFDTKQQIESKASLIDQYAVQTHTMPLGNATGMTQVERDLLAQWLAAR